MGDEMCTRGISHPQLRSREFQQSGHVGRVTDQRASCAAWRVVLLDDVKPCRAHLLTPQLAAPASQHVDLEPDLCKNIKLSDRHTMAKALALTPHKEPAYRAGGKREGLREGVLERHIEEDCEETLDGTGHKL